MNVYERALSLIERDGWKKLADANPLGNCIVVAVTLAGGTGETAGRLATLADFVGPDRIVQLWRWNDDPHTTEEDVRLLLKRAAVELAP